MGSLALLERVALSCARVSCATVGPCCFFDPYPFCILTNYRTNPHVRLTSGGRANFPSNALPMFLKPQTVLSFFQYLSCEPVNSHVVLVATLSTHHAAFVYLFRSR